MISLITFADDKFEVLRKLTNDTAYFLENKKSYRPEDIPEDFINENREVYSHHRGFGFWIWKPYIILDYLNNHCEEGDIVIYCDSGDVFNKDLVDVILKDLEDENTYLCAPTSSHFSHTAYTRRDCFVFMDCDEPKYHSANQVLASIMAWKNCKESKDFLEEWLNYCKNKFINTDEPNISGLPNFGNFIDHRHDQSIYTNLIIKKGLKVRKFAHAVDPWEASDEFIQF